jgi:hypothetical protein
LPSQQQQQQQQPAQVAEQQQLCETSAAQSHTLESVFKAGIARPEDLPAAVAAAQACLLSGARGAGEYSKRSTQHTSSFGHGSPAAADAAALGQKTMEVSQAAGLKFSRDVVVVEVSGAPVDLTLIDLPGGCGCVVMWAAMSSACDTEHLLLLQD